MGWGGGWDMQHKWVWDQAQTIWLKYQKCDYLDGYIHTFLYTQSKSEKRSGFYKQGGPITKNITEQVLTQTDVRHSCCS